jgi:potassium-transporting ATPase KdpC subunit
MKKYILPSIMLSIISLLVFVVIYTAIVWGLAYFIAPNHGNGEVVTVNGKVVGYKLVGQSFTQAKYFNGRPSSVAYNAAGSGGSNKGPSNPDYLKGVQAAIDSFMAHNPSVKKEDIPVELVTMSGSGLDPDISPKAALIQIPRIAKTRNLPEEKLTALVNKHIEKPWFGPAHINLLLLNADLDKL